jgi:DNA-binding CsgD family transcriptional regulator
VAERMCQADREWLDLVTDVLQDPLAVLPEERIAVALHETFRANGCAFHQRDGARALPVQRIWPAAQYAPATVAEMNDWAVHSAARGHPVLRYYLATHDARAVQVADVPSLFAPPAVVGAWNEVAGGWGIASQVAIPLRFGPAGHRAFVVGRQDPFTADDMALAARLQRLLVALDRQVTAVTRGTGTGIEPAAGAAHLTSRELAVLALVAEGLTSAAVARRLLIAERTVHKHLERIYAKLEVRDRLSAVLRAQRAGVLATPAR